MKELIFKNDQNKRIMYYGKQTASQIYLD